MIVIVDIRDALFLGQLNGLHVFIREKLHLPKIFYVLNEILVDFDDSFVVDNLLHELILLECLSEIEDALHFRSSNTVAPAATVVRALLVERGDSGELMQSRMSCCERSSIFIAFITHFVAPRVALSKWIVRSLELAEHHVLLRLLQRRVTMRRRTHHTAVRLLPKLFTRLRELIGTLRWTWG